MGPYGPQPGKRSKPYTRKSWSALEKLVCAACLFSLYVVLDVVCRVRPTRERKLRGGVRRPRSVLKIKGKCFFV